METWSVIPARIMSPWYMDDHVCNCSGPDMGQIEYRHPRDGCASVTACEASLPCFIFSMIPPLIRLCIAQDAVFFHWFGISTHNRCVDPSAEVTQQHPSISTFFDEAELQHVRATESASSSQARLPISCSRSHGLSKWLLQCVVAALAIRTYQNTLTPSCRAHLPI